MADVPETTARLALLEQRLARLRMLVWLAVLVAGASLAWGLFEGNDPIAEGQLWVAKDPEGRVRGMFGVTNDGIGLTMYDSTGQMRLDVGIAPGGVPGILLLSKQGEPVAALNLVEGLVPTLRLTNVAERARIEIVPRAGQPPVVLKEPGQPDTLMARRTP
ncbi:MAG: hypothetical protein SFV24_01710 [Gemmatimonadales bacterium]|nr:hypothetical protein [Gemmatimonadales bacterium]